jgi:hypothetical protein
MKSYLKFEIYVSNNETDLDIKVKPIIGSFSREFFNLVEKQYVPNKGDTFYFLPAVNIPRVKLKDLTLNFGIKTVRNIEDATHIFGSHLTKSKMCNSCWYYSYSTENFKKLYELVKDKLDEQQIESINSALEFYNLDKIIMEYSSVQEIKNENIFYDVRVRIPELLTELVSSDSFTIIDSEYQNLYKSLIGKEILDETCLLNVINGADAVTIDKVMFEQLSDMFNSSDNDNHILAMEIMANCNYLESLLYLELLFKEYSYQMSNTTTKNHVNFKSLISYLGKSKNYLNTSLDDVVGSLRNKNVLSVDKLDIILKKYSDEIGNRGDSTYFKVKSVTVSEELAEILNTNYEFKHLANYELPEQLEPKETEIKNEEELAHELYGVDNDNIETTLTIEVQEEVTEEITEENTVEESIEFELNKPLTQETNEGDDFEWF